jgi:hypothetical protein
MAEYEGIRLTNLSSELSAIEVQCLRQRLAECSDALGATLRGISTARRQAVEHADDLTNIQRRVTRALEHITAARDEMTGNCHFSR